MPQDLASVVTSLIARFRGAIERDDARTMADQQNRGGKKQGTNNPKDTEKHQGVGDKPERPGPGQPGGPKENTGQSREGHTKDTK